MSDTEHSEFRHLYAVLRIDFPVNADNPENSIAVVKVFSSKFSAEQEVSRLNKLNAGEGCRYILNITRLVPSLN
jgi:hypothetical protein